MEMLANSVIGEYYGDGYVEALVGRPNAVGPSLRVCVRVRERAGALAAITKAEATLPGLFADMATAEALASKAVESPAPATVLDIWIEEDGGASYTCGFLDAEAEDALVVVRRDKHGELTLA